MKSPLIPIVLVGTAIAVTGCVDVTSTVPAANQAQPSPIVKEAEAFKPNAPAGVRVDPPADGAKLWAELQTSRAFSHRPDPFALEPKERAYETQQTTERVFGDVGGWSFRFEPQVEVVTVPEQEPQPYRRLAGVIVGDSVLALIDMGNGQLQLIRPGQDIDGWHVVSIDAEKAVLTRSGNKLPKQIIVRLEEPPPGAGGGGGGGNPAGGGLRPGTQGGGVGPQKGNGNQGSFSG